MQIHEITIQEGLGWELTKGIGRAARDQFIQSATGVGDPYQKTDMKGYVDPNAPATPAVAATAPALSSRAAGAKSRVANAARTGRPIAPAAPAVNTSAAPEPYVLDGRQLNPANPKDARIIRQFQAQGVTSANTGILKSK